jgi:hypothetical protein
MNRLPLFCGLLFLVFFEPAGMKAQLRQLRVEVVQDLSFGIFGPNLFPLPITVEVVQDLSFGSFYVGANGGTITITPEGTRTTTGTIVPLATSTETPAIFEVRSLTLFPRRVHIVFPASVYLTRSGGSERIVVNNFKSDKPSGFWSSLFLTQRVNVGATLTVQGLSSNPPGNYAGTFSVTFAYE